MNLRHSASNPFNHFGLSPDMVQLPEATYIVSQDIAQRVDYTCTEVFRVTPVAVQGSAQHRIAYYLDKVFIDLKQIRYTELPYYTRELMDAFSLQGDCIFAIDGTGIGLPVFDMYEDAGLDPLKILFTSGESISTQTGIRASGSKFGIVQGYGVPKNNLKDALVLCMEQGTIRRAPDLAFKAQEEEQYRNFVGRFNEKTRAVKYENSDDKIHDDIICADMIAAWIFQNMSRANRKPSIETSTYERDPFGDRRKEIY